MYLLCREKKKAHGMPYLSANRGLFTMPAVGIRFKCQMPSDLVIPLRNAVRRSHMIAYFAMFVLCEMQMKKATLIAWRRRRLFLKKKYSY